MLYCSPQLGGVAIFCFTFLVKNEADKIRRGKKKPPQRSSPAADYRINRRIRAKEVRLIDQNNENHGVVPIREAAQMAQDAGLDLVEVSPNARPPVCRIMDFGKFAYEKTRKEREARKNQKKVEIKTLKLSPTIAEFHRDIQIKNGRKWIEQGKKVKVAIRFSGRQIQYPELGREMIELVAKELEDIAQVEQRPTMEGRTMSMMLVPIEAKP